MLAALTDLMTCPRCGPDWGLILVADRVEDGRVLAGAFGCPKCHARFAVEGGMADLRAGPAAFPAAVEPSVGGPPVGEREAAVRLAALLGIGVGTRRALLVGPAARHAAELAALIDGLEVVTGEAALRDWTEAAGVSRWAVDAWLPLRDGCMPGVALSGAAAAALVAEGARVVVPGGRLVLEDAPDDAVRRLTGAGFETLAREGRTVVVRRA